LVFHFERLFHKSHPNVPNPAKYQQLNRGGSVHSSHSSYYEEQQQQQQQQHVGDVSSPHNESNIVEVHMKDENVFV
jgi:hypothetical protein